MKRKLLSIAAFLALILVVGCEIEPQENFRFVPLEVISANVPEAFVLNAQHNLEITFRRPDNCTFFHDFDISVESNSERNIVVIGSTLSQDGCVENSVEGNATLSFIALENAPYTFRFYTGIDQNGEPIYLEYIIPVE